MIPTELPIGEAVYRVIQDRITLLAENTVDPAARERYQRVDAVWHSIKWPDYVLDLTAHKTEDLWDLWGLVPQVFGPSLRDAIARYLNRPPLIKLAECAE